MGQDHVEMRRRGHSQPVLGDNTVEIATIMANDSRLGVREQVSEYLLDLFELLVGVPVLLPRLNRDPGNDKDIVPSTYAETGGSDEQCVVTSGLPVVCDCFASPSSHCVPRLLGSGSDDGDRLGPVELPFEVAGCLDDVVPEVMSPLGLVPYEAWILSSEHLGAVVEGDGCPSHISKFGCTG